MEFNNKDFLGESIDMDLSSDDNDDYNQNDDHSIDFELSPTTTEETFNSEYQYEVLSSSQLVQYQYHLIDKVNNVINLSPAITRTLLNYFKWDEGKLLEKYFDSDLQELFLKARIIDPINNKANKNKQILKNGSEECGICFSLLPSDSMTGLACGHRFCLMCWQQYLTTKILTEGVFHSISCAAHGCDILVDDVMVKSLVTNARAQLIYQHLILNDFVDSNKILSWCPAVGCNNVIKVSYFDAQRVRCACGHEFCFACGENWHEPVKCYWLRKWLKKCAEDSATSYWIATNTKECPQCNVTIEKNGGCNHMICKNQNCKYDFCWICLGAWGPHGTSWYNCNRYQHDDVRTARDAQDRIRCSGRYLHYYTRYRNHMDSLKFENNLYLAIRQKMKDTQQHNMSWNEAQFLHSAVEVLCRSRQILMFTYVFAFYLNKNNQSLIFEENQKDLESATEKLSEYLERDITPSNISNLKEKVRDTYRYCDKRCNVLLDHVREGYENHFWDYNE